MHRISARRTRGLAAAATWLAALSLCCMAAPRCAAEVELTLSIRGSADEIAQVLDVLRGAGLAGSGGMKVQVESSFTGSAPPAATPEAAPAPTPAETPPPAPLPTPRLTRPSVAPTLAAPGKAALVTVEAIDPDRKIDTIAVVVGDKLVAGDLYDNGMNGDEVAGDGRWSLLLSLPATLPNGSYNVVFQAYDAKGAPITLLPAAAGATPEPVKAEAAIAIRQE